MADESPGSEGGSLGSLSGSLVIVTRLALIVNTVDALWTPLLLINTVIACLTGFSLGEDIVGAVALAPEVTHCSSLTWPYTVQAVWPPLSTNPDNRTHRGRLDSGRKFDSSSLYSRANPLCERMLLGDKQFL
jgi:hypothetical protein